MKFLKKRRFNIRKRYDDETRVNRDIRAKKVRLIDNDGDQIGIVDRETALEKTDEAGYDLVEVAPDAEPPVCRMLDYGKYKYKQQKKRKKQKQKQDRVKVKELRFSTRIEEHDIKVKIRKARKFLKDNNKVKLSVMFKGRENIHGDIGFDLMDDLIDRLSDLGEIDKEPKRMGSFIQSVVRPKSDK